MTMNKVRISDQSGSSRSVTIALASSIHVEGAAAQHIGSQATNRQFGVVKFAQHVFGDLALFRLGRSAAERRRKIRTLTFHAFSSVQAVFGHLSFAHSFLLRSRLVVLVD